MSSGKTIFCNHSFLDVLLVVKMRCTWCIENTRECKNWPLQQIFRTPSNKISRNRKINIYNSIKSKFFVRATSIDVSRSKFFSGETKIWRLLDYFFVLGDLLFKRVYFPLNMSFVIEFKNFEDEDCPYDTYSKSDRISD